MTLTGREMKLRLCHIPDMRMDKFMDLVYTPAVYILNLGIVTFLSESATDMVCMFIEQKKQTKGTAIG